MSSHRRAGTVLGLALVLGLATSACQAGSGRMGRAVTPSPPPLPLEGMVIVEGEIVSVMESWPLQLVVATADGERDVGLQMDTVVTQREREGAPGDLAPGMRIRIVSPETQFEALTAQTIEILDGG